MLTSDGGTPMGMPGGGICPGVEPGPDDIGCAVDGVAPGGGIPPDDGGGELGGAVIIGGGGGAVCAKAK